MLARADYTTNSSGDKIRTEIKENVNGGGGDHFIN